MKYFIDEKILHIIYTNKDYNTIDFINVCELSKKYEKTDNSSFIGFNFPTSIVDKNNKLYNYINNAKYIIVYKKGDKQTKLHELYHAKFYLDKNYKESIYSLWSSITDKSQNNIINMLLKMKYKNDIEILIDEFQAYYNTEKPNFFGKIIFKSKK